MPVMAKPDKQSKADVIIPPNHPNPPEEHEVDAAWILARHYNTVIRFLVPVDDYKRKTADIEMLGAEWEIKSPTGNAKNTVRHQLRRAAGQAKNIVYDARRSPMPDSFIISRIEHELVHAKRTIRRVLMINKSSQILVIVE